MSLGPAGLLLSRIFRVRNLNIVGEWVGAVLDVHARASAVIVQVVVGSTLAADDAWRVKETFNIQFLNIELDK